MRNICISLTDDSVRQLEALAASTRRTRTNLIRAIIETWLEDAARLETPLESAEEAA
jgi:predicted DNA-binding protein